MNNRHDVPQPALGLALGQLWLGLLLPFTIVWRVLVKELTVLVAYRRTARDYINAVELIGSLEKRLDESEEDRLYLRLDNEDMEKYMSIPTARVHDAMKVTLEDDLVTQALHIRVGGFKTTYSVSMMSMREMGAEDCARHIAERITRDNVALFEAWLYEELCRELSAPDERRDQTYYPDRRPPVNMYERRQSLR